LSSIDIPFLCIRAYKNLNDLKKEFHEKIESLTNGNSDSSVTGESSTRTASSHNQQQQTGVRRPIHDDSLIDPLAVGRRVHPYAGAW
jgi:hypothetical protein